MAEGYEVVLITPGTYPQYWLRTEQSVHQLTRPVSVVPLPGDPSTGKPQAFAIDFGAMEQSITLKGIIEDVTQASGLVTVWQLLEGIRETWKDLVVSYNAATNPQYTVLLTYRKRDGVYITYKTVFQGGSVEKTAGRTFWEYSLTFIVIAWPPT